MANKRFWMDLAYRAGLEKGDKILVGRNDDGESMYVDLTDLIGIFTTDELPEGNTKFYMTLEERQKLNNIATGLLTAAAAAELFYPRTANPREYIRRGEDIDASDIYGQLIPDNIPGIPASKITSGLLALARIPNLDASIITSGVFDVDHIPDIPASKVIGLKADGALIYKNFTYKAGPYAENLDNYVPPVPFSLVKTGLSVPYFVWLKSVEADLKRSSLYIPEIKNWFSLKSPEIETETFYAKDLNLLPSEYVFNDGQVYGFDFRLEQGGQGQGDSEADLTGKLDTDLSNAVEPANENAKTTFRSLINAMDRRGSELADDLTEQEKTGFKEKQGVNYSLDFYTPTEELTVDMPEKIFRFNGIVLWRYIGTFPYVCPVVLDESKWENKSPKDLSELNDNIGANEAIIANTVFVDATNGSNTTGTRENRNRPFLTEAAAFAAIPDDGVQWAVEWIGPASTRILTATYPTNLSPNLRSLSGGVFDFTGMLITAEKNIEIYCPNAEIRWNHQTQPDVQTFVDAGTQFKTIQLTARKITVTGYGAKGTGSIFSSATNDNAGYLRASEIHFNYAGGSHHVWGGAGKMVCSKKAEFISLGRIQSYSPDFEFDFNVIENTGNNSIVTSNFRSVKIKEVQGSGTLSIVKHSGTGVGGSTIPRVDLTGVKVAPEVTLTLGSELKTDVVLTGVLDESSEILLNSASSNNVEIRLINFNGKCKESVSRNHEYYFENSTVRYDDNLLTGRETNPEPLAGFKVYGTVQFLSANNNPYVIKNVPSGQVDIYGVDKTNAKAYGKNINTVLHTASSREAFAEIAVKDAVDVVNKVLDTDNNIQFGKEIILATDEYIYLDDNTYITFAGGGLEGTTVSKNTAGQGIFKSRAGGSGGLQLRDMKIKPGAGFIFDIEGRTGFDSIEMVNVNIEDGADWGTINNYRQVLLNNMQIKEISDGWTLSGAMGGIKAQNLLIRALTGSTGTLFKAGTGLSFSSTVNLEGKADFPTGWKLADFSDANFASDESFILEFNPLSIAGVVNKANTAALLPNISYTSVKTKFRGIGIDETPIPYLEFRKPDGSIGRLSIDNSNNLTIS